MGAEHDDVVGRMLADWRAVRPDLDPSPLETVGRVIVLARHLEKSVETALADHKITLAQFDILATLRRHHPRGLTPTELCKGVMLVSSGSMTNRLDRLEMDRLIARTPDPADRRGVVVGLTAKGVKRIDAATAARFAEAAGSVPPLGAADAARLAGYLKAWLAGYS